MKEIRHEDGKSENGEEKSSGKKKRVRIGKEKVDVNDVQNFQRGSGKETRQGKRW